MYLVIWLAVAFSLISNTFRVLVLKGYEYIDGFHHYNEQTTLTNFFSFFIAFFLNKVSSGTYLIYFK